MYPRLAVADLYLSDVTPLLSLGELHIIDVPPDISGRNKRAFSVVSVFLSSICLISVVDKCSPTKTNELYMY